MENQSPCIKCGCLDDRMDCSKRCQRLLEYRAELEVVWGYGFKSSLVPLEKTSVRRKMPIPRYILENDY